ncbi:MAG: hypothetical protein C4332_10965 [Meiothermus sp.]
MSHAQDDIRSLAGILRDRLGTTEHRDGPYKQSFVCGGHIRPQTDSVLYGFMKLQATAVTMTDVQTTACLKIQRQFKSMP